MAQQNVIKDFYVYSTGVFSIAPGVSTTQTIQIQADSGFELDEITFSANVNGAAQTVTSQVLPNANILIIDTGSGRQLMNVAVPISALFGDGNHRYKLSVPRLFAPRATIQITVTSTEAANTNNLAINFLGTKIYSL